MEIEMQICTIFDIKDDAAREAAWTFLGATEDFAGTVAKDFDAGSRVKLGPVKKCGGASAFDLTGVIDSAVVAMSVAIPANMPECDVFCSWAGVLMDAGLIVDEDAEYQEFYEAASDREEEWVAENPRAYINRLRPEYRPAMLAWLKSTERGA